ncbi:hypothetical protein vseg_019718 [Gypsophila vaccaria]
MPNGVRINLPALVFSHIESIVSSEAKGLKNVILPYGMWLSKMLEAKRVMEFRALSMASKEEIGDEIFARMKLTLQDFDVEKDSGFGSLAKGECSAENYPSNAETGGQWRASMITSLASQFAGVTDLKKYLVERLAGIEESVKILPGIILVSYPQLMLMFLLILLISLLA